MKVSWSHAVIKVRDIDAMIAFYCDVLGFRVADRGPFVKEGTEIVFLSGSSTDHHQLALVNTRGDEAASSLDHCAFRVESIDDVLDTFRRVDADDRAPYAAPITHGNAISVYFADPEGNGIEVFCDTPWHVPQPQAGQWDPSLSADDVMAAVKAQFEGVEGFMAMDEYRAERAEAFGE